VPLAVGLVGGVVGQGIGAAQVFGGVLEALRRVVGVADDAAAGDLGEFGGGGQWVDGDLLGLLLALEAAAAAGGGGGPDGGVRFGGTGEALAIDDVQGDVLVRQAPGELRDVAFEVLDLAAGAHAHGAGDGEHGNAAGDPDEVLAAGDAFEMAPQRLQRGQRIEEAALARDRVGLHLHLEVGGDHLAVDGVVAEQGEHLLGVAHERAGVRSVLRLDAERGFGDALAQRKGVVGEVVQHAQRGAEMIDGDARGGGEGLEVAGDLGARPDQLLRRRVLRVEDDRREVARRPGQELGAIGEDAGRQGLDGGLDAGRAFKPEDGELARLALFRHLDLGLAQIRDGAAVLVGGDDGELDELGIGAEGGRGLLGGEGEENCEEGKKGAHFGLNFTTGANCAGKACL